MRKPLGLARAIVALSVALPRLSYAGDSDEGAVSPLRGPHEAEGREDPAPSIEPRARVHIASPRVTVLERRQMGTRSWIFACSDPCDRDLPLADDYRVTGAGLRASNEFKLRAAPGGGVELRVDPASYGAWQLGVIVAGAGILTDAGALYALFLSFAVKLGDCSSPTAFISVFAQGICRGAPSPLTLRAAALIALVPGTVALVGGVAKANANWSTRVTQPEPAREAQSGVLLRTPEYRGPIWAAPETTPLVLFPLYGTRF